MSFSGGKEELESREQRYHQYLALTKVDVLALIFMAAAFVVFGFRRERTRIGPLNGIALGLAFLTAAPIFQSRRSRTLTSAPDHPVA